MYKAQFGLYTWLIPVFSFGAIQLLFPNETWHYALLFVPLVESFMQIKKGKSAFDFLPLYSASIIYIAAPLLMILKLYLDFSPAIVLTMFVMIWSNDTGAYLCGRAFGKTPLLPKVSPKKTVEGFLGGIVVSMIAGYISAEIFHTAPLWSMVSLAVVVSLFATIGDLFESSLKRAAGVKDAGNVLPGHGGFLDRFDSAIFVAPATYIYLTLWG